MYPELNELTILGETIKGAVTRRVLLEVGVMTQFDVGRATALIPKTSDNVETASAKLRVLRAFMEASGVGFGFLLGPDLFRVLSRGLRGEG